MINNLSLINISMRQISYVKIADSVFSQLAILASYSSDELVAIYRYFRSLAVENPFTTARDNLIIAFEKVKNLFSCCFKSFHLCIRSLKCVFLSSVFLTFVNWKKLFGDVAIALLCQSQRHNQIIIFQIMDFPPGMNQGTKDVPNIR